MDLSQGTREGAESLFAIQTELRDPRQNKSHLSYLLYLPDERGGEGGALIHDTMKGRGGCFYTQLTAQEDILAN